MMTSFKKILLVLIILIGLSVLIFERNTLKQKLIPEQNLSQQPVQNGSTRSQVLDRSASLNISGNNSVGGLISIASTDEPSIILTGSQIKGSLDVSIYEANEDLLLDYLIHDKEGKQTNKIDTSKLKFIQTVTQNIDLDYNRDSTVLLPLAETGVYYLKIKAADIQFDSMVVRSPNGIIAKEGKEELIFWGQNYKNRRSISGGQIKTFSLLNSKSQLASADFNSEGISKLALKANSDIAIAKTDSGISVVPLNLRYLNYGGTFKSFDQTQKRNQFFTFTDKPLYKPGDTIYFKSIIRDDDDARYTIPKGTAYVKITRGYSDDEIVYQQKIPISEDGSIFGETKLPDDALTGSYQLEVNTSDNKDSYYTQSTTYFNVEFYRKPDYTINVSGDKNDYLQNTTATFNVDGTYYSGQKVANQKFKYKITYNDYSGYEFLVDALKYSNNQGIDNLYGYESDKIFKEAETVFDSNGKTKVGFNTKLPADIKHNQIFSVKAEFDDGSGNPTFSSKNYLIYAADFDVFRTDKSVAGYLGRKYTLPFALKAHYDKNSVSGITLTSKVHRTSYITVKDSGEKYPAQQKEEVDLNPVSTTTDQNGNANIEFMPDKSGTYLLTIEAKDKHGNVLETKFNVWVSSDTELTSPSESQQSLILTLDKDKYQLNETAKLNIKSGTPSRDIFLSLDRERVNRYQVVHLDGNNTDVNIPLQETDIPNIFITASSFSNNFLDHGQAEVTMSLDSKEMQVEISSDRKKYGPSDTVNLTVKTTDKQGNPISTDLAVWVLDKSLSELTYSSDSQIINAFWSKRYESTQRSDSLQPISVISGLGGGCFAQGTKVLTPNGLVNIESLKTGDLVTTRDETDSKLLTTKITSVIKRSEPGTLIINGELKITADHILMVNGFWHTAGSIKAGDYLINSDSQHITVNSIEWQTGKIEVYNLELEKYHTFFANNIWVHNEKGGESNRDTFKDTAYWNPSVHTDNQGLAKLAFKLPDNLTTWSIAAVGATKNTVVGQKTEDIMVAKDLVIRPIMPNILRIGDQIVLSALIQNFSDKADSFDVGITFDNGEIKTAKQFSVNIASKGIEQAYWTIIPQKEDLKGKVTFTAKGKQNSNLYDGITQEIPIKAFGFWDKQALVGEGTHSYKVQFDPSTDLTKSSLTLDLAPSLSGSLIPQVRYLIDYPYECIEQTTSRMVPIILGKLNPLLFQKLSDDNYEALIKTSIRRITDFQHSSGGWSWWKDGNSNLFITSYVVEYLTLAKQAGFKVNSSILSSAENYLARDMAYDYQNNQDQPLSPEEVVIKSYALSLIGTGKDKNLIKTDILDNADVLSMAIITNTSNGFKDPNTNGVNKLLSLAQTEGDTTFWLAGPKERFGSKDASTAWAIRAMLSANVNKDTIGSSVKFLANSRHFNYWSNTYTTAQVIRAIIDFSKVSKDLTPNYTYSVDFNSKNIASDKIIDPQKKIAELNLGLDDVKQGSILNISKDGEGSLYSTLLINQFNTDKNARSLNNGLTITREYTNNKSTPISVGDIVTVKITVSGVKDDEAYAIVDDQLPSGMIPINNSLKNEQYNQQAPKFDPYTTFQQEVNLSGATLSSYKIAPNQLYTHKARVVNAGTFIIPPASASLMYTPEVNGRTAVQSITISGKQSNPFDFINNQLMKNGLLGIILLGVVISLLSYFLHLKKAK